MNICFSIAPTILSFVSVSFCLFFICFVYLLDGKSLSVIGRIRIMRKLDDSFSQRLLMCRIYGENFSSFLCKDILRMRVLLFLAYW